MENEVQALPPKVEFLSHHLPGTLPGKYNITVSQDVKGDHFEKNLSFHVAGAPFNINEDNIEAIFPADQSLGDHSNVLPHIILNRSTIPWEKGTEVNGKRVPWLALIVFHEGEEVHFDKSINDQIALGEDIDIKPSSNDDNGPLKGGFDKMKGRPVPVSELPKVYTNNAGPGAATDQRVMVIDVDPSFLENILPQTYRELIFLTHVRQGLKGNNEVVGDEKAVIIANRLPLKNGKSVVHLVSVEGLYNEDNLNISHLVKGNSANARLVSLKNWTFYCTHQNYTLPELLNGIGARPLALPTDRNTHAGKYIAAGFLPLPHQFLNGQQSISWYHGPLSGSDPGTNENLSDLPVPTADYLLRYDNENGMLDISYAAAWELGRLLALNSKNISVRLFQWKRGHLQLLKSAEQELNHPHLVSYINSPAPGSNSELPEVISDWFYKLRLLKGIPFNYLVPDERMLPVESIRFFHLDTNWIHCLIDGAFSVGRISRHDQSQDTDHRRNLPELRPEEIITGFLIRSEIVSGWPGLNIEGKDANGAPLTFVRREQLSKNVEICLFEGRLKKIVFHLPPESLHFGLDQDPNNPNKFIKKLRKSDGTVPDTAGTTISMDNYLMNNRLKVQSLINTIENKDLGFDHFTSAEFALTMLEGVPALKLSLFNPLDDDIPGGGPVIG